MTENQWIRDGCIAAAFFMAVTLFFGAETAAKLPLPPLFDKVAHFGFYATMAALLAHGVGRSWLILPLILVPVVGAADEWHQSFIIGRDASFWDWMADEAGTVFAVFLYWTWTKSRAGVRGAKGP